MDYSLYFDAKLMYFVMIWYLRFFLEQHHPMIFYIIRIFAYDVIVCQYVLSQSHNSKSGVINHVCSSKIFIWRVSLDYLPIISCNTFHNRQQSIVQIVTITPLHPMIRRLFLNKCLVIVIRIYSFICMIMSSHVKGNIILHHFCKERIKFLSNIKTVRNVSITTVRIMRASNDRL